jgi:hypothetical protein
VRYSLARTRDGAGDSGLMSTAIFRGEDGKIVYENNARPRVGVVMQVGSFYARTYDPQDYWQTTMITEILEDTPKRVRFRTSNSEYVWKII